MPSIPKPESAPSQLSNYGVANWHELLNYPVMDGSGSRLAWLGHPRHRPRGSAHPGQGVIQNWTTSAEENGTWETGPEGMRLVLGTTQKVKVWDSGGADVVFKRISVAFDFASGLATGAGSLCTLWQTSSLTTTQGRAAFFKDTTGNPIMRVRGASGNMNATFNGSGFDWSADHQLLWTKGRKGMRAWLDGVEATYSGGFDTYTGDVRIHSGQTWTINHGAVAGQVKLSGFAINANAWHIAEVEDLIADKYANLRPDPADCPLAASFDVNRVNDTQFAMKVPANHVSLSRTLRVRLVTAATAIGLAQAVAAGTYSDSWTTATPDTSQLLYSTGNTPGARLLAMVTVQGGDGVYRPHAGQFQRIKLDAGTSPRIAGGFEDHVVGRDPDSGALPTIAFGTDISHTDAADLTENSSANRLMKALHDCTYSIYTRYRNKFDFGVHIGDGTWGEQESGGGTAAGNAALKLRSVTWRNAHFRLYKAVGVVHLVEGNHDGKGANFTIDNLGADALRKQALGAHRWLSAAPDGGGVEIADRGLIEETLPNLWNYSPDRFRSGKTVTTGMVLTAGSDDLRAYEVVGTSGNGVLAAEPSWDKTLGAPTTATGADGQAIYFRCRARWDSVCVSAYAPPALPSQTWYSFRYGGHEFFIGDSEQGALIGIEDANGGVTPSDYTLPPAEKAAIVRWGRSLGGRPAHLFIHRLPGGKNYRAAGTGWYARIAGHDATDPTYWEAQGVAMPPDQLWLVFAAQTFGFVIYQGHNHHFCICTDVRTGVVIVTLPTCSASSHADPTFGSGQPSRSWRTVPHRNDFGTGESDGLLDNAGNAIPGNVKMLNGMGFVDIVCQDAPGIAKLAFVRTGRPVTEKNSVAYTDRIRKDVDQCDSGPFAISGGQVTLTNADGETVDPLWIACVLEDGNRSAAMMTGTVTEAAAETQCDATHRLNVYTGDDNDVLEYGSTTAYSVGMIERPITFAGLFARVKSITTGMPGGSEPSWPNTIGATVVDGGVTWEMIPASEDGWNDFAATIAVDGGASGDVYVDFGPAVLYQSDDLATLQKRAINDLSGQLSISGHALRAPLALTPDPRKRLVLTRLQVGGTGTVQLYLGETADLVLASSGKRSIDWRGRIAAAPGQNMHIETSATTLNVRATYTWEAVA